VSVSSECPAGSAPTGKIPTPSVFAPPHSSVPFWALCKMCAMAQELAISGGSDFA